MASFVSYRNVQIIRICFLIILHQVVICETSHSQNSNFSELEQMVKTQIEDRGVSDPTVLNAFRKVDRRHFVLPEYISAAYGDHPLPIGEGQTISQPYVVALMTETLNLKPTDKVLEIGTGSGYQAAILAQICDSVFTIEIFETLGEKAKSLFMDSGYKNIFCKVGDGYLGWPEYAPFDAIIVTCSPTHIPMPLQEQLAEGGRMIIPVGMNSYSQQLVYLEKQKGKIKQKNVLPVRFVPMISEEGEKY